MDAIIRCRSCRTRLWFGLICPRLVFAWCIIAVVGVAAVVIITSAI